MFSLRPVLVSSLEPGDDELGREPNRSLHALSHLDQHPGDEKLID